MDWKYKHFNQTAVFKASTLSVQDAAREVASESLGALDDTSDGFTARGRSARHTMQAIFHITPDPEGAQVTVELLVERAAGRGFMLVDIGNYFNGQIDRWFAGIAQRLGEGQEQVIVRKTTSGLIHQRGCLAGCLVYLIVGACLSLFALPFDHALFPSFGSILGPFSIAATLIGLLAGVGAYRYFLNPNAPASQFIRAQIKGLQKKP